jgi:dTDP-4-amino-4,6-dideoxygalactose transaminase
VTIPLVDVHSQYAPLKPQLEALFREVLESGEFIRGPHYRAFEEEAAAYLGVQETVGVANGTDAIVIVLDAMGIGPGDEVICPAFTFYATAESIARRGATPVFADVDPVTLNVDPEDVAAKITERTRAIMPVHLFGRPAAMDDLVQLGLPVIEDAAQAHGTLYQGRPCGSLGTLGCFSFYPGKNLGAYGDGGMVTTNDAALAARLRRLRDYGQQAKYEHVEQGLNARLDALQAAILGVKLPHLTAWNAARARHAEQYRALLNGVGDIAFQGRAPDSTHIYHLFIVETEQRDALQAHLTARGIATGIHYPIPIHLQPAYATLGHGAGDFPATERLARRMLSLPMYAELRDEQIAAVAEGVRSFFG